MSDNNGNHNGNGARGDEEAKEIFITPQDRVVLKSTTCANCTGFDAGSDVLRRWSQDPKLTAYIKSKINLIHVTGLRIRDFEEGKAALAVAKLMAQGMTQEQALLKFEEDKILQARSMVGPGMDWAWADIRMQDVREIAEGLLSGKMGVCTAGGVNNDGLTLPPLSPLFSGYHCHKWTGRAGWSLAHDADRKLDPLPAELTEIADGKAKPSKD